jgi:hypothetical protein
VFVVPTTVAVKICDNPAFTLLFCGETLKETAFVVTVTMADEKAE